MNKLSLKTLSVLPSYIKLFMLSDYAVIYIKINGNFKSSSIVKLSFILPTQEE